MNGLIESLMTHSETWGMVWFGFIFWGSVINAMAVMALPSETSWLVAVAAYATGLAMGALAKARGRWL